MEELLQQLITNTTGKTGVGDTSANTGECVGLCEIWLDMLGLNTNHLYGNAIDLPTNANPTLFSVITNTADNFPVPGDIAVLGQPYGETIVNGVTTYLGHCGVVISADVNSMTLLEQNDPDGSTPHQQTYNYSAQNIKWLHPIKIPATSAVNTEGLDTYGLDPTNEASNQVVFTAWHDVSQGLYIPIAQYNALKASAEDLQSQVDQLNSSHVSDTKEIVTLNSSLEALTGSNKNYGNAALEAEKVASTYTGYMDDIANELTISDANQTDSQLHDEIIKEIVALRQNQKAEESTIAPEKTLTTWENGFKNIVDWILQHGLNDFLKENNLQVVDLAGNPQDDGIADKVIAYLDTRFNRQDVLESAMANVKTQVVKGKSLIEKFFGMFVTVDK